MIDFLFYFSIYMVIGGSIAQWYFVKKRKQDNFSYTPIIEILLGIIFSLIWPTLIIGGLWFAYILFKEDKDK